MKRTLSAPRRPSAIIGLAVIAAVAVAGAAALARWPGQAPEAGPIRIGAVFPIAGSAAGLAGQELAGVRIAADLVNADGGIEGRRIELDVRDLERGADAPAVMASLRAAGANVVVGAYSS